jgi:serine phosphatase RsbU (regulator of sigma subunit)
LAIERAGERLGVLEIEGIALPEQRPHYLNLALTIVDVLGLAVSNARLHERLVQARAVAHGERDLARDLLGVSDALNEINATIASTLDFDEVMSRVVVQAAEATRADKVGLLRRDDVAWRLEYGHGYREGAVGTSHSDAEVPFAVRSAKSRELVYDNDAAAAFAQTPGAALVGETRSIMCVPLVLKGEVFGVLTFRSRHRGAFNARSIDFAQKLASSLSLALHNAQLFAAQRTIADTLQQALLVMPKRVRGIEFGNLYQASTREEAFAGGDFYDIFEIDHTCVGVVIGDISGKGLEAAKLTSLVKDAIRAYTHIGTSPAWVLEKTNRLLFDSTEDNEFATVFLGVINTRLGEISYCSAGHPTGLIRATDGVVRALAVRSTILGAFEDIDVREGTEKLAPGEVLVLYTDGITEARCSHEFFGEERLVELVSLTSAPPAKMPEALLERIKNCPDAMLPDDVAILCVALANRKATEGLHPAQESLAIQ